MRFFPFLCLLISLVACHSIPSQSFKLEGLIEGAEDDESLFLSYHSLKNNEWSEVSDTAKITNGQFSFEENIDGLTAAELVIDNSNVVTSIRIYLEPTTMKLRVDRNKPYAYELSGTKAERENMELRKELASDEIKYHECVKKIDYIIGQTILHRDNPSVLDSLIHIRSQYLAEFRSIPERMAQTELDFVLKHNDYQIIPDILFRHAKSDLFTIDTIANLYYNLPEKTKNGLMGQLAYKQIDYELSKRTGRAVVSSPAPDFTRKDFKGEIVRLSDFKNRNYVLLDFWANWCVPCVKEIPKLKELYGKYKDKGLMIISISLDSDRENWLEGIDKYQLGEWPQVLNIEDNSLFNKDDIFHFVYNVDTGNIPHFILIDKQGIIQAQWKELGEDQLNEIDKLLQENISDVHL